MTENMCFAVERECPGYRMRNVVHKNPGHQCRTATGEATWPRFSRACSRIYFTNQAITRLRRKASETFDAAATSEASALATKVRCTGQSTLCHPRPAKDDRVHLGVSACGAASFGCDLQRWPRRSPLCGLASAPLESITASRPALGSWFTRLILGFAAFVLCCGEASQGLGTTLPTVATAWRLGSSVSSPPSSSS